MARKNPITLTVGSVYYSGNATNANIEKLEAFNLTFLDLPEDKRPGFQTLARQHGKSVLEARFVLYSYTRVHDHNRAPTVCYSFQDVFEMTRYESVDAMIRSYIESETPSRGLPGAILPGEYR